MQNSATSVMSVLYVGGDMDTFEQLQAGNYFNVERRENSLLAVDWIENGHPFDAIVCEQSLPGINGMAFFELLKQRGLLHERFFILIHEKDDPALKPKAMTAGVHDLYLKPFDPKNLSVRLLYLKKYPPLTMSADASTLAQAFVYRIPPVKRAFDIFFSGMGLLFLSPFFLIIAALIRLESKGKVFYASKRVGTGYKVFDFYKFRSMFTGADLQLKSLAGQNQYATEQDDAGETDDVCPDCAVIDGSCSPVLFIEGEKICENQYLRRKKENSKATFIKILNDPRVTRVGRFIRKTSIDELPQLFNVLIGDMSIVGNRPLPLYEAEMLTSDEWGERFLGPAGITGLWQVNKRGKKDMSDEERKQLDNQYARNYSFWGDIKIILRTIPALLQKEDV